MHDRARPPPRNRRQAVVIISHLTKSSRGGRPERKSVRSTRRRRLRRTSSCRPPQRKSEVTGQLGSRPIALLSRTELHSIVLRVIEGVPVGMFDVVVRFHVLLALSRRPRHPPRGCRVRRSPFLTVYVSPFSPPRRGVRLLCGTQQRPKCTQEQKQRHQREGRREAFLAKLYLTCSDPA